MSLSQPQPVLSVVAPPEPALLTIGTLATRSGVTVRTLRYYEELDLIAPVKRSQSQYRLYSPHALKRIEAVLALQSLNYSLEAIATVLGPASYKPQGKQQQLATSRAELLAQQVCLKEKQAALDELKAQLDARLSTLEEACTACVKEAPLADCEPSCQHRSAHLN